MKAYLSHPIRGKLGVSATVVDMKRNCAEAIAYGTFLREFFRGLDVYIPAEHEDFIQKAYDKKYLSESHILEIDCEIVGECDFVIVNNRECISHGMQTEIDYANENDMVVLYSVPDKSITDNWRVRIFHDFMLYVPVDEPSQCEEPEYEPKFEIDDIVINSAGLIAKVVWSNFATEEYTLEVIKAVAHKEGDTFTLSFVTTDFDYQKVTYKNIGD